MTSKNKAKFKDAISKKAASEPVKEIPPEPFSKIEAIDAPDVGVEINGSTTPLAEVTPEVELKSNDDALVIVTVPKAFQLRLDAHKVVSIKVGVQKMALNIANHWYSKVNGVEIFNG